jgi:uncharacterized ion transporter superfamily protein YfcC
MNHLSSWIKWSFFVLIVLLVLTSIVTWFIDNTRHHSHKKFMGQTVQILAVKYIVLGDGKSTTDAVLMNEDQERMVVAWEVVENLLKITP